jgi:hypothetical protein
MYDLIRDRVADRHIGFGVIAVDRRGGAVRKSLLRQSLDHAGDAVVEHRAGGVLQDGDFRN